MPGSDCGWWSWNKRKAACRIARQVCRAGPARNAECWGPLSAARSDREMRVVVLRDERSSSFLCARFCGAFHFQRDDGLIVELFGSSSVILDSLEERFHEIVSAQAPVLFYKFLDASPTEENTFRAGGIDQAVAEENEDVPGAALKAICSCSTVSKSPKGQADSFDALDFSLIAINGAGQSGVRDLKAAILIFPDGVRKGNVLSIDATLGQRSVDEVEHFGGPGTIRCMGTKEPADQRRI